MCARRKLPSDLAQSEASRELLHSSHTLLAACAGLMVTERNWLLVFHYTTWGGNANLPHFVEGMQFTPTEVTHNTALC